MSVPMQESPQFTPEAPLINARPSREAAREANAEIRGLFRSSGRALAASEEALPDVKIGTGKITYNQTLRGPLAPFWEKARAKELNRLKDMGVFRVVKRPPGANIIRGHLIHTPKLDSRGRLVKCRSRCVADGGGQLEGVDYFDTSSPTPSPEVERLLLTYAANKDLEIDLVDADCAYLHAELDIPVYMHVPKGLDIPHESDEVLLIERALYGLKQAGRQWYHHLKDCLAKSKWVQNPIEPCLYKRGKDEYLLVYVDDILILTPSKEASKQIKSDLTQYFPIKDLGEIREYLGIEVVRDRKTKTIRMRQLGSIEAAVGKARHPVYRKWTPASSTQPCVKRSDPATVAEHEWYRSVVGQLSHISRMTRPDIALSVNLLCRAMASPTQ